MLIFIYGSNFPVYWVGNSKVHGHFFQFEGHMFPVTGDNIAVVFEELVKRNQDPCYEAKRVFAQPLRSSLEHVDLSAEIYK
jgi:hypothetical protein